MQKVLAPSISWDLNTAHKRSQTPRRGTPTLQRCKQPLQAGWQRSIGTPSGGGPKCQIATWGMQEWWWYVVIGLCLFACTCFLYLPPLLKESLEYYEFQLGDTVQCEGSMGSCGPSLILQHSKANIHWLSLQIAILFDVQVFLYCTWTWPWDDAAWSCCVLPRSYWLTFQSFHVFSEQGRGGQSGKVIRSAAFQLGRLLGSWPSFRSTKLCKSISSQQKVSAVSCNLLYHTAPYCTMLTISTPSFNSPWVRVLHRLVVWEVVLF